MNIFFADIPATKEGAAVSKVIPFNLGLFLFLVLFISSMKSFSDIVGLVGGLFLEADHIFPQLLGTVFILFFVFVIVALSHLSPATTKIAACIQAGIITLHIASGFGVDEWTAFFFWCVVYVAVHVGLTKLPVKAYQIFYSLWHYYVALILFPSLVAYVANEKGLDFFILGYLADSDIFELLGEFLLSHGRFV